MTTNVVDLGPHERMTVEELFAAVSREPWETVLICGYHEGNDTLIVRSSRISREFGLWMAEHLKQHILGND